MMNIYSVWTDPAFYAAAAIFAFALFLVLFSIRKYQEIENNSDYEDDEDEAEEVQAELPMAEISAEDSVPAPAAEALPPSEVNEDTDERPAVSPSPEACSCAPSRDEEFMKSLYDTLVSLDGRVKNIEADLSKSKVNRDFTAKFLEDMVSDFESLDKTKIKARIEYLLADLKK